jgi:cytochrome c-type biogenesis protein CcmH/NrfG
MKRPCHLAFIFILSDRILSLFWQLMLALFALAFVPVVKVPVFIWWSVLKQNEAEPLKFQFITMRLASPVVAAAADSSIRRLAADWNMSGFDSLQGRL